MRLLILSLVLVAVALGAEADSPIVGEWKAFEFEGRGPEKTPKSLVIIFRADGTFNISQAAANGKANGDRGTYTVMGNTIELFVGKQPAQKNEYSLDAGTLTLRNPELKSVVKFKRVGKE